MSLTGRQVERYLQLVNELGERYGKRRGWLSAVADDLGVHRSTMTKLVSGERLPTSNLVDRACNELNLDRGYFSDPRGRPFYQWILQSSRPAVRSPPGLGNEEILRKVAAANQSLKSTLLAAAPKPAAVVDDLELLVQRLEELPIFRAYRDAVLALRDGDGPAGPVELVAHRLVATVEERVPIVPVPPQE